MLTDPIADFLTRLRNANQAGHEYVEVPFSKMKLKICEILKEEKFIESFEKVIKNRHQNLRIYLKYGPNKERTILNLKRISKPGRRIYVKVEEIPVIRGGLGISILSTPKGILSCKQAKKLRVGGELLCQIY
jgi:small subunit ribosomal protein S8